jgi:hypothetical protein
MKYIAAVLAFAACATAQSISACGGKAQPCLDAATASSGICSQGDWACGCENMSAIQGGATSCVLEACGGASGALAVLSEVQAICANLPPASGPAPADGPAPASPAPEAPAADTPSADSSAAVVPAATTMATQAASTAAAKPTGSYSGPVVNGAGAAGPIVGLVLGAAALAF